MPDREAFEIRGIIDPRNMPELLRNLRRMKDYATIELITEAPQLDFTGTSETTSLDEELQKPAETTFNTDYITYFANPEGHQEPLVCKSHLLTFERRQEYPGMRRIPGRSTRTWNILRRLGGPQTNIFSDYLRFDIDKHLLGVQAIHFTDLTHAVSEQPTTVIGKSSRNFLLSFSEALHSPEE